MNTPSFRAFLFWSVLFCSFEPAGAFAQAVRSDDYSLNIIVLEGSATVAPAGTDNWAPAKLNQKLVPRDKIHTEALSRVVLRSSAGGDQEMRELTDLIVKDPRAGSDRPAIQLVRGFLRSFIRGRSPKSSLTTSRRRRRAARSSSRRWMPTIGSRSRSSMALWT